MQDRIAYKGYTFDDLLLEPGFSEIVPAQVDTRTRLTARIAMNIPILSAPMDTVTEANLAIALAQEGGLGIIHKNLSIDEQALEVDKVKRSENGIIVDPITLAPEASVGEAREIMVAHNISGVPIVQKDGTLAGILTRRDLRFLESLERPVSEVMTKGRENLIVAPEGTSLEEADLILNRNKVEKLLLVDGDFKLRGLITIKDIDKIHRYPHACKDSRGRLRVGAAVGVMDFERVRRLVETDVDVITVDSAHGHSRNVIETVKRIKADFSIEVIAGNVATFEGAKALADAGADAVKVGIGPGSICTTRVVSGVGVPQMTAIFNCSRALKGRIPLIADGGIRYSGDIAKAIAAGANCVMIGGLFAGLAESPGEMIIYRGRSFKTYRGMGSLGAMAKGSSERYRQESKNPSKFVPEGVEGRVPYKGPLADYVYQLVGGLKAGMGYCGTPNIEDLHERARFIEVTGAGVHENHPHDIVITQEAPNYTSFMSGEGESVRGGV
ncbi:IMP dehydrogenase [bacterium]|nr:IMP dehydrogenase [bacterium]